MKKILFFLALHSLIKPTFFLNRFWTPELTNQSILSYRHIIENITIQPFVMTADKGNKTCGMQTPHLYEIDGLVSIANLYQSYLLNNPDNNQALSIPSEWIASKYTIPIRLNGAINATGFGWNFSYQLAPGCLIGWSSGYSQMTGAINIQPQEESNKYKLKEGMLVQINTLYNHITNEMNINKNYTQFNNFADQDIYIRFDMYRPFCLNMRQIKWTMQLGGILPTAHTTDPFNPADIPGGTNGFKGLYAGTYLDLLLKEDINLGLEGKLIFLAADTKLLRTRRWFESSRYGSFIGQVDIEPGWLYEFSPSLSIEGLRRGLGCKVAYSTWGQTMSKYGFKEEQGIIQQIQMNIESMSSWNQEHCTITFFYDFAREKTEQISDPFLAFSAQIPVDFFFAHSSARSLALSFSFQLLY
jgi:hypothetical protein